MRLHEDENGDDGLSSGLGLSLAKQIIVNAGGQLWYEQRKHGGSRFIIELPEAASSDAPAEATERAAAEPCKD
jgi:two-component system sensor histidine kinase/response regulator